MKSPVPFIAHHLLVCLTLAFILGISLSPYSTPARSAVSFLGIGLVCFVLLLGILYFFNKTAVLIGMLLPLFAGIGFYDTQIYLQPPPDKNHIFNRIVEKTEAVVVGTLASIVSFDGSSSQITLASEYLRFAEKPDLQPTTGKILLKLPGPLPEKLMPGDEIAVRAILSPPDSSRTPGVFDYANYLAQKNIWMCGFVRSTAYFEKLAARRSFTHTLRYLPERLREMIGRRIDTAVPTTISGVYRAILIGDRSRVDSTTLEGFKGSGTVHILAISGLHMTVIGTLLYLMFFWFLSRSEWLLLHFHVRKIAALLSLPILICYSFLAGLNTPVIRAAIMSCIVIIALCTDRKKTPSTLLAFAALVILVINPLQLFTASFQLSFSAVLAILFLYPVLKHLVQPDSTHPRHFSKKTILNWIIASLLVSAVATLATTPISLWFFNRFSLIGVISNLFVEPLVCLWSLPAGFIAIIFLFIQPDLSDYFLSFGSLGLNGAIHITNFLSSLPFATLWRPSPPPWLLICYYASLLTLTWHALVRRQLSRPGLLIFVFSCLIMITAPKGFYEKTTNSLRISFIDVGQGSSTLLEYPSGQRILIDGGGSSQSSTSVGERIIAPFLWHKGIRRLDAIAITHPDADHYNGLPFIIRNFSPSVIWVRDTTGHDNAFKQLMHLAKKNNISLVVPNAGQSLGDKSEYLSCIANTSLSSFPSNTEGNRQSANTGIVLKACYGNQCALFPGDIGMSAERSLINLKYDLTADFLLAPHHGSSTSNSPEFLSAVAPDVVVVSAGRSGRGYFPHNLLINECGQRNIPLMTTSGQGTLNIVTEKHHYQIWGYARPNNNPLRPFDRVLLSEAQTVHK